MRSLFILLLAVLLTSVSGVAQKPTYGFKLGFNFGKWSLGEPTSQFENKFRLGIVTGFNAEIPVTEPVTIQAEILYSMFGSVFRDGDDVARYKANYMLFPVMARYNLDNGLSFMTGPQFGLLISAKSNIDGEKYNFRDDMKKGDIFLAFGAEYKLKTGIALGFRYQHGLTNTETGADVPLRNRGISLTATYKLKSSFREMLNDVFKS
jgi:hypothetical protein